MRMGVVLLGVVAAVGSVRAEEGAEQIIRRHEEQKVAALERYVNEHPQAKDLGRALDAWIESLMGLGRQSEALAVMLRRYEVARAQQDAEWGRLYGGVIRPVVELCVRTGRKAEGRAFVERVSRDFAEGANTGLVAQAVAELRGLLARPVVGETVELGFKAVDGREVELSAMRGKVVLVSFWATWCGWCQREVPVWVSAYQKYGGQEFEIVSVSLDRDREALLNFLKARKIDWPQHFDGKGWENELAVRYGIKSIPATFLVGRDGKVVATDLRGEQLERKLAELVAVK
jgi:thiol-disulfide isomerase/thioredoxin